MIGPRVRHAVVAIWLVVAVGALYLYAFQRETLRSEFLSMFSMPFWTAAMAYVLIGSLRPLTLVPATFPLLMGLPFFEPWVLLALTLPTIAISSSICYWFAETLHLADAFEREYPSQIRKLKDVLQRRELPIIIGWSFLLFLPTDLICYVCGSLRINFKKFLIGVLIGEGTVYAIYIFVAHYVMPN